MSAEEKQKTFRDTLIEESEKGLTPKDRVKGILLSVSLLVLGVSMWIWPEFLSMEGIDPSGRGGRRIVLVLEFIWSRPVGVVLALAGCLGGYGSLTKHSAHVDAASQKDCA